MINDLVPVLIAAQAVAAAVPLLLAGLGELCAQRAGVLNIGIEGLLLAGCIGGFVGAGLSGCAWIGLASAIAAGALLAGLFAWATVVMRCDQIVAGMAINLLAVGGSGSAWMWAQASGHAELPAQAGFARGDLPFLGEGADAWARGLPLLGPLVVDQYVLALVAGLLAALAWWTLRATRAGVVVHALGDAPDACAAAGIDVRRWRFAIVVLAGCLAGAAGAYLSIMRTHGFTPLMTGGMGFVVLALVIFARWRIAGLVMACLGFAAIDALQSHLQGRGLTSVVPYQLFQALPYVVALSALALMRRGEAGPRMLGRPWPEER
jgi:simple sugar transport system permease protein